VEPSRLAQAVFLLGVFVVVPLLIVRPLADGWEDWVVYGVIVVMTFGAFRAIFERRYTTQKRTFIHRDED
jgi:hypothetical protein